MKSDWDQTTKTNTNSNENKMQVSDKTAAIWMANPAKRFLAEAGISSTTKKLWITFFEQMQLAMGGTGYKQPSGDIESQGTNR